MVRGLLIRGAEANRGLFALMVTRGRDTRNFPGSYRVWDCLLTAENSALLQMGNMSYMSRHQATMVGMWSLTASRVRPINRLSRLSSARKVVVSLISLQHQTVRPLWL